MFIVEPAAMKRRPGRPPLDPSAPTTQMSVRLTTTEYDALCARAQAHG